MDTTSYDNPQDDGAIGPSARALHPQSQEGNPSSGQISSRLWRWGVLLVWLALGVCLPQVLEARGGFTVVLDAGHGGKDPGAVGNGVREKEVTLDVVLRLGKMIQANHPEVRVVYTRDKDVFVGLQTRADIANRHKASLFISVHVNSASSSTRGTETYTLGLHKQESNLSVAMRENNALLLEDNYKATYKGFNPRESESYIIFDLMQEAYTQRSIDIATHIERQYKRDGRQSRGVRQAGFWVLAQSAMPSVLTEIGFLSNPREARYLGSAEGRAEIARGLSRAFSAFYAESKGERRSSTRAEASEPEMPNVPIAQADRIEADEPESIGQSQSHEPASSSGSKGQRGKTASRNASKGQMVYRIQFSTLSAKYDTQDKRFARFGKPIRREQLGKLYAYTTGEFSSLEVARKRLREVRKLETKAFIVSYQGGKRIGRVQ